MNLDYPPGATPLDPDEAAGLIPSHIANHGQLNEWEMVNIIEGERWAFGRRHRNLLGNEFVCALHKRMFGNTWRWAGKFRTTEKNIGVDPLRIRPTLHDLCEGVQSIAIGRMALCCHQALDFPEHSLMAALGSDAFDVH